MRGIEGEDTGEGDSGVIKSEPLLSRDMPAFTLQPNKIGVARTQLG